MSGGDTRVSLAEVMRLAGVSTATAQAALRRAGGDQEAAVAELRRVAAADPKSAYGAAWARPEDRVFVPRRGKPTEGWLVEVSEPQARLCVRMRVHTKDRRHAPGIAKATVVARWYERCVRFDPRFVRAVVVPQEARVGENAPRQEESSSPGDGPGSSSGNG